MSMSHFPKAKRMALPTEFQNRTTSSDLENGRVANNTLDTVSVHSTKSSPGYVVNHRYRTSGNTGGTGSAKSSVSRSKAKKLQAAAEFEERNSDRHAQTLRPQQTKVQSTTATGRSTVSKMEGINISQDINANPPRNVSKPTLASVDGNWVIQGKGMKKGASKSNISENNKPKSSSGDSNNNASGVHYDEEGRLVGAPMSMSGRNTSTSSNNNKVPLSKPLPQGAASVLVDPALYRNSTTEPHTPTTPHSENSSVFDSMPTSPSGINEQAKQRQYRSIDDYIEEEKEEYEARAIVRAQGGIVQQQEPARAVHHSLNGYTQEHRPVVVTRRPLNSDSVLIEKPLQVQTVYRPHYPNQPIRMIRAPGPGQRVFVRHPAPNKVVRQGQIVHQPGVRMVHPRQIVHVYRQPVHAGQMQPIQNLSGQRVFTRPQVRSPMRVVVPPRTPPSPTPHRYVMSTVPRNFHSGTHVTQPHIVAPEEPIFNTVPRQRTQSVDQLDPAGFYQGQTVRVQVPSYSQEVPDLPTSSGSLVTAHKNFHSDPNLLQDRDYKHEDVYDQIPYDQMPSIETGVEEIVQSPTLVENNVQKLSPDMVQGVVKHETAADIAEIHHMDDNEPRMVVLQRGKGGFGFVLRGAKSHDSTTRALDFSPTAEFPALQYLDRVEQGSASDKAGLKPGDFLLEINQENVASASHEHTVNLIKKSGTTLAMKVVTVKSRLHDLKGNHVHIDGTATLPLKRKAPPTPPARAPGTSLSMTKTQGLSVAEGVVAIDALDRTISQYDEMPTNNSNSLRQANKTASIGRHHGKRMSSFEMNDIFARESSTSSTVNTELSASHQQKPVVMDVPRVYGSPEGSNTNDHSHVTRVDISAHERNNGAVSGEFNRTVVDVAYVSSGDDSSSQGYGSDGKNPVYAVPSKTETRTSRQVRKNSLESSDSSGGSAHLAQRWAKGNVEPSPDYPSPERTESTEVVKINTHFTSNSNVEVTQSSDVESSFRPGIDARMSKEPDMVPTRSRTSSSSSSRSATRSYSLHEDEMKTGTAFAITATAIAANHESISRQYLEPTPDYHAEVSEPPPRPVRHSSIPQNEPVSPTPDYDDEDKSMSDFNNAIKMAALAREKRANEQPVEQQINNLRQTKHSAPPPPKTPPPSENVWPRPVKHVTKETPTQSLPAHIQKQLEEDKKREHGRNDLMAAIAKRRTMVEKSNMEFVANNIEKQVQKRNVQSKVFAKAATETKSKEVVTKSEIIKTEAPKAAAPPPPLPQDISPVIVESETDTKSDKPVDFAALAEKKRQDWLLKRQASNPGTLEKPVKKREPAQSSPVTSSPNAVVNGTPPPPPIPSSGITPREPVKPEPIKKDPARTSPQMNGPSGMADFASMVANRAMTRQKSQKDETVSGNTIFSSLSGPKSPTSPKPEQAELKPIQKRSSIEIRGATTTYSHTETPLKSPPSETSHSSVLARSKMLEGKVGPKPGQTGNKIVYRAKPTSPTEKPPPMIPASSKNAYSRHSKVVNGEFELNKPAHVTMIKDEDIPIVPPPPMFEVDTYPPSRPDDSVSMVSDVSSLSSLSSIAQDSPKNAGRTGTYNVAPPPPGFNDGDFVPPPTEFATEAGQPNLKSIKRASGGHSMSFPAVTNPRSFQSKPIDSWSKEEVGHWLDSVNMSQYKSLFNRQNVAGPDLVKLSRREFSEMGITHVGQRMELEKAIKSAAAS